jgi:hypothetical protein
MRKEKMDFYFNYFKNYFIAQEKFGKISKAEVLLRLEKKITEMELMVKYFEKDNLFMKYIIYQCVEIISKVEVYLNNVS